MRDYVLTCAVMNQQIGFSPVRMLRNWIRRKELARMDAHALALLKIDEEDRQWAVRLRLDIDPFVAIEDRAFRKSRKQLGLTGGAQREPDPLPPFCEAAPRARKVILSHAVLKVDVRAEKQARWDAAASLQGASR